MQMPLGELRRLIEWAGTDSCVAFQEKFRETVRRKVEDVDHRIVELHRLRDDLVHLEAHLGASENQEGHGDHSMIACSPETCTCLGSEPANTA